MNEQSLKDSEIDRDLGAFLLKNGMISDVSLQRAVRAQRQTGERLDRAMRHLGLIAEEDMIKALAGFCGMPLIKETEWPTQAVLADDLSASFLKLHGVIPILEGDGCVRLAVCDPLNRQAVEAIEFVLQSKADCVAATPAQFEQAFNALYGGITSATPPAPHDDSGLDYSSDEDIERLRDLASEAPIVRLASQLIETALDRGASDIHVEPLEDSVQVRLRIDGMLQLYQTLPASMRAPVTSRLKVMARLNIAERRLPQDGRIRLAVRGRDIDFRVSTMPTMHGESVVMRILDRSTVNLSLEELGFDDQIRDTFGAALQQPNGIVLVSGPTGSGKTTTLYTALRSLNKEAVKVFTVEDPVEYELRGVNQTQVHANIGMTFANALRSILRQDPDVIMLGEIRDVETARIAVQASLTGHLVLSTVHTNSAAGSISRLLDMGVENFLLGSTVTAVLAQRLVRKLCRDCSRPKQIGPDLARALGFSEQALSADGCIVHEPQGCPACRNLGYRGRTVIAELLSMNDDLRELVVRGASELELQMAAERNGLLPMYRDGLRKVLAGITSIEEVLRVTVVR